MDLRSDDCSFTQSVVGCRTVAHELTPHVAVHVVFDRHENLILMVFGHSFGYGAHGVCCDVGVNWCGRPREAGER